MLNWFCIVLGGFFLVFDVDYFTLILFAILASVYHYKIHYRKIERNSSWRFDKNGYPKVLVQLPMFNEEACCESIIRNCCLLTWPRDSILIQVLDDSTKPHIRQKVDSYCDTLIAKGYPVQRIRRTNREGYKAGAMVQGLKTVSDNEFKYVAIFDADFQPNPDFLLRTVPYLENDDTLGFVQTRWVFRNVNSALTWCQKVSLEFHFCIEQQARSYMGAFFNFNGTAGVWRIACIKSAGGWQADTVVEDMDLSLRAYLQNWCFLYLHDIECYNELPATVKAYRIQQYRWLAGPMQIVRKSLVTIYCAKNVSWQRKLSCYIFFLRYILFAILTVSSLAVPLIIIYVWPLSMDEWESLFFIASVNATVILMMCITLFSPFYLLFCISIGYYKTIAMVAGALNLKSSQSWVVTSKSGGKVSDDSSSSCVDCNSLYERIKLFLGNVYMLELAISLYYLGVAADVFHMEMFVMGSALVIMSVAFLMTALGDSGPLPLTWCRVTESEDDLDLDDLVEKDVNQVSRTTSSPSTKKKKTVVAKEASSIKQSSSFRVDSKRDREYHRKSHGQKYELSASTNSLSPSTSSHSLLSSPPRPHPRNFDLADIESGCTSDYLLEIAEKAVPPSAVGLLSVPALDETKAALHATSLRDILTRQAKH